MPLQKKPLHETAGVRLVQVDDVSPDGRTVRSTRYRLTTLRPNQPREIANKAEALDAFGMEVIASLSDPVVRQLTGRA